MSTATTVTPARRHIAINLARLLVLSTAASALVLANPGAASASTSSFAHWVDYDGGTSPNSVAVGDFNSDGDPDVATAGSYVSVVLGGPGGTFGPEATYDAGLYPESIAIGDFDTDGNPDIVVVDSYSDVISVLLGSPDGTFGEATSIAVVQTPTSVAVGDFNGDGDPDLAVTGSHNDLVSIMLGESGSTFGPATTMNAGLNPLTAAIGDFNGDGDPDLAVGGAASYIAVLLGGPTGTFGPPTTYDAHVTGGPDQVNKITIGDFNGDSDPDLVLVNRGFGVEILLGTSGGSFATPAGYTVPNTADVAVADFNDDAHSDLAISDDVVGQVDVLHGNGDGTFGNLKQSRTGGVSLAVAVGDFDADHLTDVVVANRRSDSSPSGGGIAVLMNSLDTSPPDTTITGGPDGQTNDNTPTFTFTSSEAGSTFECSISGGFVPCTSPYTTDSLGDGDHTFRVRAIDAAGNVDATPASRSFTLDRNPPTTSITSGPSGATGDSTPTFGFTSPDPDATFECRVDDAAFEACPNPHTAAELGDGEHVFQVRAVDSTGNVDPIPAAVAFTVDTVAPDTTIGSGPTGTIGDNTPTFGWEYADGAAAHECRVDNQPFTACESPETTDALSDGQHTFELRAIDFAGNTDPTPASRTFTVDTEALVTGITSGPSGLMNDSTPTFSFATSDPGSAFECRVLPAGFEPCASPYTADDLADGEHTFQVRSIDSVGNVESPPVGRTFTVDTSAPDTTITSGPTGTTDDQTPTFGFDSPEAGATLECRVDSAAFGPCASPYTTALLANGSHTFQARATDAAGNTDPTPASRTFTVNVDTTAPITTIDSGPGNLSNQVKPAFTFSADEPATFECNLDGGSFAPCQSGAVFGPLDEGSHTFSVRATDLAGNVDPTPATKDWIVDTTPPQTTITSAPPWLALSSRATFVFTSSEGGSTFQCQLDGGAWQVCTSPRTYSGIRLGNRSFAVRAIDPAGNTDPTPAERTWLSLGLLPF